MKVSHKVIQQICITMDYTKYLSWIKNNNKKFKSPTGPHGSEGMAGDYVCGYVRDSAAHMGTKLTIKDV